jgi:2-keto-4-pentenoate hydratase
MTMPASIRARAALTLVVALLALRIAPAADTAESWADIIMLERARGEPLPVLSQFHLGLGVDAAYAIQRALVQAELPKRRIAGYKAGFTTAAARKRFGLDRPAAGVLFADGERKDGATIDAGDFAHLMLEVELGFVLRSPITRRMRSVADLLTYVRHAVPVVELPDPDYAEPLRLRGVDVIATNLSPGAYVIGAPLLLPDLKAVNGIEVTLERDGEAVTRGVARAAMGDQLQALLWLVNELEARGWRLSAGQILLTGSLGEMLPATPGRYRADYGGRGSVSFTITGAAPDGDGD